MAAKRRRPYGDGALFYKESRDLWVARLDLGWDDNGNRKRWEATSKTREGALNKLRKARNDIATLGMIPTTGMTTQAWLERWLEDIVRPHVKPGTYADYRQTVAKHLTPRVGNVPIATLSPTHVRALYKNVSTESSIGNANKVHRVLRAALSDAEREGIVPRNVAKLVRTTKSTTQRSALSADDAKTIIAKTAQTDPMAARWAAALLTGARQGEILGLTWDRIDLDAGTLDISWQLQRLSYRHACGGTAEKPACKFKTAAACPSRELDVPDGFEYEHLVGAACMTRPKSARSTRKIPIPLLLVDALKKRRRESIKTLNPHGLVWTDEAGNPVDDRKDLAAWYAMLDSLDIERVPLHSARHTTATLLMELGVDVTIIQSIMGHSQATTTQAYQHADLTMARKALDQLGTSMTQ